MISLSFEDDEREKNTLKKLKIQLSDHTNKLINYK